jgi:hypothetical protein
MTAVAALHVISTVMVELVQLTQGYSSLCVPGHDAAPVEGEALS